MALSLSNSIQAAEPLNPSALVGKPVDIASSAYQYRADRKPTDNPPESWLAVMRFAGQALNKPADINAPKVKQVVSAFLWEEIRPVQQVEVIWSNDAARRPGTEQLVVTTLDNQGSASSWWNNLKAVPKSVKPLVSGDGTVWIYELATPTCGIVFSVTGAKNAADYEVPKVRVLVADVWKAMDVEIEWGFDEATSAKDYSGRIETYDGVVAGLAPLQGDTVTTTAEANSWQSSANGGSRRGVKASLAYMGTFKWREGIPFTSQMHDVARTIVTVWTKSGNFSFSAADLEYGPILAPEYGFFVRRLESATQGVIATPAQPRVARLTLAEKMNAIAGNQDLRGWGSDGTWFGGNPTDRDLTVSGINIPAKTLAMHPGNWHDVAVGWRSSIKGAVAIKARVAHAQGGSSGIEWRVVRDTSAGGKILAQGSTDGKGERKIPSDAEAKEMGAVSVEPGDLIALFVGAKGNHQGDSTLIELVISEVGGRTRVWNLTEDVVGSMHAGNPHADTQGQTDTWHFFQSPAVAVAEKPTKSPFRLASQAASARDFLKELQAKERKTIRQQIRARVEQTWEGAVTGMCGTNLPPHPKPPAGSEPAMQVQVPSERLTAQWNLGAWHLVRHCGKNPSNGRLWFNDHPYGILAAETYMILAALDLLGSHAAAEDGYDQWVSLPMDPSSKGHHGGALPDRPIGLFTEGRGCLTHAVGPKGVGGHMDGVHAFGPGSIGWALVEHYRLTGDSKWFKTFAPRIKANVEWMLRQRQTVKDFIPGGERLWCKGLQPALQVTPDSGGLWMQFYESEAYYWAAIAHFAEALATIDPVEGGKLIAEAELYRKDLRTAVERTIALSPVVPVRDGTFHSVIPFACYVRGLSTGAWGWKRDGSGGHVGPMYWETVQSAAALVSPAGLMPVDDVRVQGYLDVLEDRLLLENPNAGQRSRGDWFLAGWQYQGGLERTSNMHLAGDDVPVFLRSFLNCYAIDILPNSGYIFNEHAVQGPPDKIYEEAAFLERFRNMLVMEDGQTLWLARATPRVWLEQGKKISVKNAPTHFGTVEYEIISDVDNGKINATVKMPTRNPPKELWLRLRHPQSAPIKSVTVNGKDWKDFNNDIEVIVLKALDGAVVVTARY